ncbi:conserved hypothetcial protein [Sporisorium reilianum SRZ2]|uniref:Mediator of RNA polymerase II transcription subunit 4 n=1 Tax=Sporisorium reilianum (strain SRZ2) TaxID=999809 RepID=E6ZP54_SPORE|nr:conserved hypothetcial protein [Sporisorium reilianum SRZ2]
MQAAASASAAASTSKAGTASSTTEATTSSLLLSTLGAYSDLTKQLFSLIENPSTSKPRTIADASAGKTWTATDITGILSALHDVDQLFSSRIQIAHQHAINQSRIERLQAQAKRKDRETRRAILELSQIQSELSEITRLSEDEVASIERAEKQPIGHATLLAYAQRLARYTSAPPGYKLPQVASAAAAVGQNKDGADAVKTEQTDGQPAEPIALGADYNQYAKRAAAYYDPTIPSMPQEMPFPSDAMMRQGILNSHEMLNGAPMAEQPTDDMAEDQEELLPAQDFAASYSHLREQQQRQQDDEDAFDLDLN